MANPNESSPLLKNPDLQEQTPIPEPSKPSPSPASTKTVPPLPVAATKAPADWTAEGLPLSDGSVVGEPLRREQWDSSLFACLGRNDEFCSSDLEVCLLGSFAPCVLYGSNVERLGSGPGSFANSCLPYAGLYMLGNSLLGGNCIAPWFSYPSRTTIRRNFNLEIELQLERRPSLYKIRSLVDTSTLESDFLSYLYPDLSSQFSYINWFLVEDEFIL